MIVVSPPCKVPRDHGPTVFLAGAIDEGRAEPWQDQVIAALTDLGAVILNPRRADWQPEWSQHPGDPRFIEQVEWELTGIETADWVLMVFTKDALAPISLLELGLRSRIGRMAVVCPLGYWRRGNVELTCRHHAIPCHETLAAGIHWIRERLREARGE